MSCAGVEVASDNLKMRMPDSSGCRSSLSLLSTRQVCHLNYPPFCVVSVKCQHWAGDEGIACSVPMDAPYSPGRLCCCQSPAGRKGAEQELRTPCLQEGPTRGSVPERQRGRKWWSYQSQATKIPFPFNLSLSAILIFLFLFLLFDRNGNLERRCLKYNLVKCKISYWEEQDLTHTYILANFNGFHNHIAFTELFLKCLVSP